eukprot:scaffold72742_cov21-Tisochrysis_lutea.AAC.2
MCAGCGGQNEGHRPKYIQAGGLWCQVWLLSTPCYPPRHSQASMSIVASSSYMQHCLGSILASHNQPPCHCLESTGVARKHTFIFCMRRAQQQAFQLHA